MASNHSPVHGYSLLRTQLNKEYFNDIFDLAAQFGVDIEGHRENTSHTHASEPTNLYFQIPKRVLVCTRPL